MLREARHLLSSLAVFMEQARHDERVRYRISGNSYVKDISDLENKGIYHLLCNLQKAFLSRRDLQWEAVAVSKDAIRQCRFREFARSDNRNFMVLYTLENVLNNLAHQLTWSQQLGR